VKRSKGKTLEGCEIGWKLRDALHQNLLILFRRKKEREEAKRDKRAGKETLLHKMGGGPMWENKQ